MKLLIVDDDKFSTLITTWVANKSGIFEDVHSVSNGREALDIFQLVNNNKLPPPGFYPARFGYASHEWIRLHRVYQGINFSEQKQHVDHRSHIIR